MVGTIAPLVKVAPVSWAISITLFMAASTLAGAVGFSLVAHLGAMATLSSHTALVLAFVAMQSLALVELTPSVVRMPSLGWSVPRTWWESLGPMIGSTVYGCVLGFGITTVIPYAGFYALVAMAILLGPEPAAMIGVTYGITRAVPVLLASVAVMLGTDSHSVGDHSLRIGRRLVKASSAAIMLVLAAGLLMPLLSAFPNLAR